MTYEELKRVFFSDPTKNFYSYTAKQNLVTDEHPIHLIKVPVVDKVQSLYMMKPYPFAPKLDYGSQIGCDLWYVGLLVNNETIYVANNFDLLGLEDVPYLRTVSCCYKMASRELQSCAAKMVEAETLPALDEEQMKEAEDTAMYDFLFGIIPFPDLSALPANYNDSEITLSYLSNRPHWAEMMAERWLQENKEECLSRIAVHKQVEKLVQDWKNDSKSKAHIYKSMKDAADKCDGFLIVDCSVNGEAAHSFRVQSVVFGNQYGDGYDMIPYLEKIADNSHISRRPQGYILKENIVAIRDRTGNKVIWRKGQKVERKQLHV